MIDYIWLLCCWAKDCTYSKTGGPVSTSYHSCPVHGSLLSPQRFERIGR